MLNAFDGTKDEFCVTCKTRNAVDNPVCKTCGGTIFIYGWGIRPLKDGEGFQCSCGNELTMSSQIATGSRTPIYESLYICDQCKKVFGTQLRVELPKERIVLKNFCERGYPMSRSQARRIIECLNNFQEFTLDFEDISNAGQAFCHEVFVVFQNKYPNIKINYINANEAVSGMITRVLNTAKLAKSQ